MSLQSLRSVYNEAGWYGNFMHACDGQLETLRPLSFFFLFWKGMFLLRVIYSAPSNQGPFLITCLLCFFSAVITFSRVAFLLVCPSILIFKLDWDYRVSSCY